MRSLGRALTRVGAYLVSFAVGFVLAALIASAFGTLGAFLVGIVLMSLGALLLVADGDARPITVAAAYLVGLAVVSGWIPLLET